MAFSLFLWQVCLLCFSPMNTVYTCWTQKKFLKTDGNVVPCRKWWKSDVCDISGAEAHTWGTGSEPDFSHPGLGVQMDREVAQWTQGPAPTVAVGVGWGQKPTPQAALVKPRGHCDPGPLHHRGPGLLGTLGHRLDPQCHLLQHGGLVAHKVSPSFFL